MESLVSHYSMSIERLAGGVNGGLTRSIMGVKGDRSSRPFSGSVVVLVLLGYLPCHVAP